MHQMFLVAALVAVPAAGAMAQPAPTPATQTFTVPKAYAGYSQPEVTACRTVGPGRRECTIPAMTAGRYVAVAAGQATASGAGATQSLAIGLGARLCVNAPKAAFTAKAGLQLRCVFTVLNDTPLTVAAVYSAENGALDPAGPQLVIRRLPWDGVVESAGGAIRPKAAPAAQGAPQPKR